MLCFFSWTGRYGIERCGYTSMLSGGLKSQVVMDVFFLVLSRVSRFIFCSAYEFSRPISSVTTSAFSCTFGKTMMQYWLFVIIPIHLHHLLVPIQFQLVRSILVWFSRPEHNCIDIVFFFCMCQSFGS